MTTTKRRVTNTAVGAALLKALEAHTPPELRLYDDPIVERLLPAPSRTLVAVGSLRRWMMRTFERSYPGLIGNFVCRTRQIDEVTRSALGRGARSVVILGAGFDTRGYRMPELAAVPVFELDLPPMIARKRAALARAGVSSGTVRFVAIDLESDDLAERLRAAGWDAAAPALFLAEGVTQYLGRDAALAVLRFTARAAARSEVCFTYIPRDVIDGRSTRAGAESARRFVERGLWVTGFDPATLAGELAALGLDRVEDVGAAEYAARYLAPRGRDLRVFEIERVALARVRG